MDQTLNVEKHGEAMQLSLQATGVERFAVGLAEWAAEGESLIRCVHPDFAETAIFQVVAAIRA